MSIAEPTRVPNPLPTEECSECGCTDLTVSVHYASAFADVHTGYRDETEHEVTCDVCGHHSMWTDAELDAIAEAA